MQVELVALSACKSFGTSLRCTSTAGSPSRPGVATEATVWSVADGVPSPQGLLPGVVSQRRCRVDGADGVTVCASHGTWVGPEGCELTEPPRWGPCPTVSVGQRGMGCARRRRERVSREGAGSTRGTAAQTRVAQISLTLGLAVEGGPYPSGTQAIKACSTVG